MSPVGRHRPGKGLPRRTSRRARWIGSRSPAVRIEIDADHSAQAGLTDQTVWDFGFEKEWAHAVVGEPHEGFLCGALLP